VTPLRRPIVCIVTSGRGEPVPIIDTAAAAARAGADLVQIRERRLDDRVLLDLVRLAIQATSGTRTRVVVNDRSDIALAGGADGVHLRERSMAASRVRVVVPDSFLVGRSVHSLSAAREAEADGGCDYLVFGTVFHSLSKPDGHGAAGVDALAEVCRAVRLPVLAIGGITEARVADVARAGAAGIAAISLFADPAACGDRVASVRRLFDTCS
jgi:thiamine-phosphate pyrophosphorylase